MGNCGMENATLGAQVEKLQAENASLRTEIGTLRVAVDYLRGQADRATDEVRLRAMAGKYSSKDSIAAALEGNATILVKGSWMEDFEAHSGQLLPRRQDLPQTASWERADLMHRVPNWLAWSEDAVARGSIPADAVAIVGISYCWEEVGKPDPRRKQLGFLAKMVKLRIKFRNQDPVSDVAIFLDFCSLYQAPRTEAQQQKFDQGLQHVNLWYGHMLIEKWLLTGVFPGAPASMTPYSQRGWPQFERAICELQSPYDRVLDVGDLQQAHPEQLRDFAVVNDRCEVFKRPMPLHPDQMAAKLGSATFTNGADRASVAKIYARTFVEILGTTEELNFGFRDWAPEEMITLISTVLPLAYSCRKLDLQLNHLDSIGCALLAKSKLASQLSDIVLSRSSLGTQELAALLQGLWPSLESLELIQNNITDSDAQLIADALPKFPKLQRLYVQKNMLTELGKRTLRQASTRIGFEITLD